MEITKLLFTQTNGVFFVWKTQNDNRLATFLRKRDDISSESQIDQAVQDGGARGWELVGVGYWWIQPVDIRDIVQPDSPLMYIPGAIVMNSPSASLLSLKKLPERERRSTEQGREEMREEHIPVICEQIRKILWENDPVYN
jgi:hypothetical protein